MINPKQNCTCSILTYIRSDIVLFVVVVVVAVLVLLFVCLFVRFLFFFCGVCAKHAMFQSFIPHTSITLSVHTILTVLPKL